MCTELESYLKGLAIDKDLVIYNTGGEGIEQMILDCKTTHIGQLLPEGVLTSAYE